MSRWRKPTTQAPASPSSFSSPSASPSASLRPSISSDRSSSHPLPPLRPPEPLPLPDRTNAASHPTESGSCGTPPKAGSAISSELKNAILFASILERIFIVPPVLNYHAVALGRCPIFKVASPTELCMEVFNQVMDLVRDRSIQEKKFLQGLRANYHTLN